MEALIEQPLVQQPRNAGVPYMLQKMLLAMFLHSGVCSSHLQHLQDCAHLDLLIPHLPGELWISLYHCMEVRQSSLHANRCWPTC